MSKLDTLEIDGVTYRFSEADIFVAKANAELLLSLAKGAIKVETKKDGSEGFDVDINPTEILSNITGIESRKVQEFILSTVTVVKDGQGVKFTTKTDQSMHLNGYRSHIYPIIIFGAKFHFLDFIPTTGEFAKSIIGQAMNRAVAKVQQ